MDKINEVLFEQSKPRKSIIAQHLHIDNTKTGMLKLAIFLLVIFIIFIIINYIIIDNDGLNIKNDNTLVDSFYFTTTMVTSTGFGDMTPVKNWSKMLISLEQLIMFGTVVGLLDFSLK